MKFIKNLIKKLGDNYIEFFKNYLFTNIAIIISTILTIIFINKDIQSTLLNYEIFFCINFFTVENLFKKTKPRVIGYVVGSLVSVLFGYLFTNYEPEFTNFFMFYLISMASVNLYYIIKDTKKELSTYLYKTFSNLVSVTIINIVLTIGVMAVVGIISALLLPENDGDIFLRSIIAILGFYTIPAYLYALINEKSNVTELANILLKYVILPLTYLAATVIYIYIIKIVIQADIPSNYVFSIILVLFMVIIPVVIVTKELKIKNKFVSFIDKNISYIFLPLYILQAYAMFIRINTYGMTDERYLGVVVLIVELIILFLMKFKEGKKLTSIFFIVVIISAITFIIPKINYEDLSTSLQACRIERVMKDKEFKDLNGEDKAKVVGSYHYLDSKDALDKIKVKLNQEEIATYEVEYTHFYETYETKDAINISMYTEMKKISVLVDDPKDGIKINDYTINLDGIFNEMIAKGEVSTELIIGLDDMHDLYIESLYIEGYNHEVKTVNLTGYILSK